MYETKTKNWLNGSATPAYGSSADTSASDDALKYSYAWIDPAGSGGPREVTKTRTQQYGTTTTTTEYDAQGHILHMSFSRYSQSGTYSGNLVAGYDIDMGGGVTKRYQAGSNGNSSTARVEERYYRFGGLQMGEVGNDGTANVDFATTIDRRADNGEGFYRGGATSGTSHADFDNNHVTLAASGAEGQAYTARGGESLQQVARLVWGDSSLWYRLAEANPGSVSGASGLAAGTTLRIPGGVQVNTHSVATHAPYDPAEKIGDVQPGTPTPPKGKGNKCGVFGAILLAVVAVAVSIALPGGGTFVGGAINAALGSAASQAVGLASGIQDKFSFKGVALAAISGGISGGISELGAAAKAAQGTGKALNGLGKAAKFLNKGGIVSSAARGALSSAITQGIATASGLQSKFSFAGVATAGVGALAGSALGGRLGAPASKLAAFGQNLATTTASGIANAATRSAINGNSFGDNLKAAIPDIIGQAVGGALGRAVYDPGRAARRQVEEPLAAGKLATDGEVVAGSVLAQSLGGYIPTASDTLLAGIGAPLELAPALRIQLLENSGAIGSEQAADLRARSARLRHEIVTDLATRASATGSGSETYRNIDLRDGERGIALNAAGYAATHAELNLRYVQLGAERKAGNIDDAVWATLQQARVDNAALINEWNAIADREVINLISSVYGGVDVAKGTYRIAVNGEHTTDNYISAGAGLAGAALGGVVKVGAKVLKSADIAGGNVIWNNGWRTTDGKFTTPLSSARPGAGAEVRVWDAIAAKPGWSVDRGAVAVRDASGQLRYYDGVAISPNRKFIGIEVKSGNASLTPAQRLFDTTLNSNFSNVATGVGKSTGTTVQRSILIRPDR